MNETELKKYKDTSKLSKEEIIAMLEKHLSSDVIYDVEVGFDIETRKVALNGMLGHKPGVYTSYGFQERVIKISW
jgi:hypothetical protein